MGVGVALFVFLCILGVAYFLIRRRRTSTIQTTELQDTGKAGFHGKQELEATEASVRPRTLVEIGGDNSNSVHEPIN